VSTSIRESIDFREITLPIQSSHHPIEVKQDLTIPEQQTVCETRPTAPTSQSVQPRGPPAAPAEPALPPPPPPAACAAALADPAAACATRIRQHIDSSKRRSAQKRGTANILANSFDFRQQRRRRRFGHEQRRHLVLKEDSSTHAQE
jgi:hypothetical protein